ncbi:processed acidic surface protein [Fredinandcohnia quinoae]|uniref:Processed acidic surface protein n=1 Tax=Fredinandcohnia quinoae TaxID=2918902 RepID=A0AAW5E9X0_9BACI|nr:processed acidic surface protein [Fredinandcohnia sp. SECRCQ15]MCH1627799.1 processed acidic surface protein [Fredinandcohnia sp. SECRCQ15]
MKRFLMSFGILTFYLFFFSNGVSAEVSQQELDNYFTKTGLTEDALKNYLSVYDLTLKDFDSVTELTSYLGSPVTKQNLNTLLTKHNMNESDLQNILGGFGETVSDYLFIKDLETTVDFYFNHAEVLVEAEQMLSEIGLTEDEIDGLFLHFLSLKEISLDEKMRDISTNLEQYFTYNTEATLTSKQKKELLALYDDMISIFELAPKYYLVNGQSKEAIAYNELLNSTSLGGADLLVEIFNQDQEFLLDIKVTEDMLASDFILERGEKLLTVATLANEMSVGVHGEKLPTTALPYGSYLLLSAILILIGICLLFYRIIQKR